MCALYVSRMRDAMPLQGIPVLHRNFAPEDGFNLPEQQADLRNGVFGIGRDGLSVLSKDQKLMARAGIGAAEAQRGACE